MDVRICEFNGLSENGAAILLAPCVAVPTWAQQLVAGRPYDDVGTLLERARRLAEEWSDDEVRVALSGHPRIGERSVGRSAQEQAGVDHADTLVTTRLAEGNRRYEERFGRIYLVRAAGRSAEEMLTLLEQRLGNDDITEMAVTKAQLAEIALLRLQDLFS